MYALIAAALLQAAPFTIERDPYGVPTIRAATVEAAFEGAGYAVAQDRLWQIEMSRRLAEGRLAEVLGPTYLRSDRDVLRLGSTETEIDEQIARLSPTTRAIFEAYARGVNRNIEERKTAKTLPEGYTLNGFGPRPWTAHDSAAIAIQLLQRFGSGGGGELRSLALLSYLQGRPQTKPRAWDILDDLAWQNDKDAIPTCADVDDLVKTKPEFPHATRAESERQFSQLPPAGLFELAPALTALNQEESKAVAMRLAVPYKVGSYCIVVGPGRSATGKPLLLSGPQMGFTEPSIAHEMALRTQDGLNVTGLDVPGAPGVLVGATPDLAWGITTGVADVEDVYANPLSGGEYSYGRERVPLQHVNFSIPVKGAQSASLEQLRTRFGPVLVRTGSGVFSVRRAYEHKELSSLEGLYDLYRAKQSADVEALSPRISLSFNLFFATAKGETGWRYEGLVPIRNPHLDPRLPTPGQPENEWRGMVPLDQMPHQLNPKGGLIVNWNNKPVGWWPNLDTPVWGAIFRNAEIVACLTKPKLAIPDLELAIWTIARRDETWRYFAPFVQSVPKAPAWAQAFEGLTLDGSREAAAYEAFFAKLRHTLFEPAIGNLVAPQFFNLALQPSLMLRALQGRTKFDYLAGRSVGSVLSEAMAGLDPDTRYAAPAIRLAGLDPIPYSNRGTYIQILELDSKGRWSGRSVLPPGEAESGPHAGDQANLSRAFTFKPSLIGRP